MDRLSPGINPASAYPLNLCLQTLYCVTSPLGLSVIVQRLCTRQILLSNGSLARSLLAFCATIEGKSFDFLINPSLSLSSAYSATNFLLFMSLLPHFFNHVTLPATPLQDLTPAHQKVLANSPPWNDEASKTDLFTSVQNNPAMLSHKRLKIKKLIISYHFTIQQILKMSSKECHDDVLFSRFKWILFVRVH